MSHNTYDNIVKNKGNIDYCIEVRTVWTCAPAGHCLRVALRNVNVLLA